MSILMPPQQVQWLIRWGLWMIPAGVLLTALAANQLKDMGRMTGFMLVVFGMSTPYYRRWLTDRGLWMLSALVLTIWLPIYVCIEMDAFRQLGNAQNPGQIRLTIDTTCAAFVMWQQVKFQATIIWVNRGISKTHVVDESSANNQQDYPYDDDHESSYS